MSLLRMKGEKYQEMSISLYCKNENCPYNMKLEEPISFSFSAIYTPFEGDKCKGKCSIKPYFCNFYDIKGDFVDEGAECGITERPEVGCDRLDCVHNQNGSCTRTEILVDKINDHWACKCFAYRKIRGHTDWSALLQGGHAKGGHIADADAEKMNKYAKTTRSYRTHMKQFS